MLLNKHFLSWVASLSLLFIPLAIASFTSSINDNLNFKKIAVKTDTVQPVVSKKGNAFITNYNFLSKQVWSICQDNKGQMLFAHNRGICVFSGHEKHEDLKLPILPIKLINVPEHEIILVGGDNQFGYLKIDNKGRYKYNIMSAANKDYGEITNIKLSATHIYFFSEKTLSIYNRKTLQKESEIIAKENEEYYGMFLRDSQLYLIKKDNGLYNVSANGNLKYIKDTKSFSKHRLMFSLDFSKDSVLLGISSNEVYSFDGIQLNLFKSKEDEFIKDNQLVDGIALQGDKFVLGTLSNGVFIIDKEKDKIIDIINYQNGLPDDEIFAMFSDKQGNIWLSHGFGISKVNYNLPIKDYNFYPGIEGKLVDVLQFDNTIYVATTEGVFYLDVVKSIKELNTYTKKTRIKRPRKKKFFEKAAEFFLPKEKQLLGRETSNTTSKTHKTKTETEEKKVSKKKNFFQRWKQRRNDKKQKIDSKTTSKAKKETKTTPKKKNTKLFKKSSNKPKTKIIYTKQSKKILELSYVYKKIEKIKSKCKQILKHDGVILAATNNGLYEIKNKKAAKILSNVYINTILPSKRKGVYYIGTNKGISSIKLEGTKWKQLKHFAPEGLEDKIFSIAEDSSGNLWLGSDVSAYKIKIGNKLKAESFSIFDLSKKNIDNFEVRRIDNDIFFLCRDSIYMFDSKNNTIEASNLLEKKCDRLDYITSQEEITWIGCDKNWKIIGKNELESSQLALTKIFKAISNIKIDKENNIWLVDGSNKLYKILKSNLSMDSISQFEVYIKSIHTDDGSIVNLDNIEIDEKVSTITFNISTPYYIGTEDIEYQYIVRPIMTNWSDWKQNANIDFIPQSGEYTVQIRARNIFGTIRTSQEYNMVVNAHIWEQIWFIMLSLVFFIALIFLVLYIIHQRKAKKLREHNKELEEEVKKRTVEIQQQKNQLERKNKEITHSINYASKIQSAILPPLKTMNKALSDSFVLNRPRDIVSGDFYWLYRQSSSLVVAVGDCTGHGVPGAFLSILSITYLNEIALKLDILNADVILNLLRNKVTRTLNQRGYDTKRLDGLDLALVVFNIETDELQFAGANNPVYIVRNGVLTEIKADKMPIGMDFASNKPFTNHTVSVEKGDSVYLFSDGYIDQFGGKDDKKFLSKNFKELIKVASEYPMKEQKNILTKTLDEWRGKTAQLDDVMIVGFKI